MMTKMKWPLPNQRLAASIERVAVLEREMVRLVRYRPPEKLRLLRPFFMDRILFGWRQADKKIVGSIAGVGSRKKMFR